MQGITEFLPVSSDGHLVLFQGLFGMTEPHLLFNVTLHMGTLAAILFVFRKDVGHLVRAALRVFANRKLGDNPDERMLLAIVAGCVPTALIGVIFAHRIEQMFASITAAGVGLLITGLFLLSASRRMISAKETPPRFSETVPLACALLIGTGQGLAIAPGISRSGTTIAIALLLGVERELAARFSFMLAIPAIFGAFIFEMKDYSPAAQGGLQAVGTGATLLGTLVALLTGIIALNLLLRVVKRGKLSGFAYYCWAVGFAAIAIGILKG